MKIILLTGFLGAGKTTLLSRLLTGEMDGKVGVLVNEFGDIGIDGRLIHHADAQMIELNKGSIFCACLKSKFYDALALMEEQSVDWLFVEASGLADPSTMESAMTFLRKQGHDMVFCGAVCLVDAVRFSVQVQVLPVLKRQIWYSDLILLNKTDLQTEDGLVKAEDLLHQIQPSNPILRTQYCNVETDELMALLSHRKKVVEPSLNTRDSRMVTVTVGARKTDSLDKWKRFVEGVAKSAYRLKGFICADEGGYFVSGVGDNMRWEIADECAETELVLFSSVGVRLRSVVIRESNALQLDVVIDQ